MDMRLTQVPKLQLIHATVSYAENISAVDYRIWGKQNTSQEIIPNLTQSLLG